ncbi:MAG TPA: ABC transporter permease [Mucilaginibacter sp.]|jgi:ABC-type antimicrobial peptide transport system permease subunit|nr:ABC transporter permease [Mucilaginibacter sp.]
MIKNYLKIAWRNLSRNKIFSVIKILGLSIGLAVCMLIFLYTKDEVSYDQFHQNKAQIFRITQQWQFGNNPPQSMGNTNAIVGESFAKEIPEIQQVARINGAGVTVKKNNNVFAETPLFVDDNFFGVFTFPLIEGNKTTALTDLHSVVLSEDMAKKYFGTADAVGKIMQLKLGDEFENFAVTAITENSPQNSTLKADMLLPLKYYEKFNSNKGWFGGSLNTFLLLSPRANLKTVEGKMQKLFDINTKEMLAKAKQQQGTAVKIKLGLQPLTAIHLSTEAGPDNGMADGSNPVYSYILTCIAVFVLVIACINFINLAIAQSLKRSKEIGIRKVVGGTRRQLIKQFLTESLLVSIIAFAVAIFLTLVILPFFNELANKKLSLSYLSDGYLYAGFFLLLIVTSFIAGFYPSLVLSAFKPVKVLYNKQKLGAKNNPTKGLVVLQFTLSVLLIIGTIAINSQLNFLLHTNPGYDSTNLVRMDIPISNASDKLPELFKNELANKTGIISVAAKNGGRSISGAKAGGKNIEIENNKIDDKLLPTFKIPIIAGRNFSSANPSDAMHAVIVNESFVKEAGWKIENAIGKTVELGDNKTRSAAIVGVVKDYHFTSFKEKITPELFSMDTAFNYGAIWVKISPANIPQTLAMLQNTYKKLVPYFPYSYQFLNDINARNYETETKWKQIISIASMLFIFISCIGLFGLVILSIEQRKKEIGIRKVLGAAVSRIVVLISREFVVLISISFAIAAPIAWYAINKWLQGFAYRISISWWMFALAGASVISIALVVMSFQTIRAALANPVKSLKTE